MTNLPARSEHCDIVYKTVTIDENLDRNEGAQTQITMQLVEYYQLCAGQLIVPEDYTLWKDVKLGSIDAIFLTGISNGDCEYEIGEISITINQEDQAEQSDNLEQQNDYVSTV